MLTDLQLVLLVGYNFLLTGTMFDGFKSKGNLFVLNPSFILFVSLLKLNSDYLNILTLIWVGGGKLRNSKSCNPGILQYLLIFH